MDITKRIDITIESEDAEKIIERYVEHKMQEAGYALSSMSNGEGPFPTTEWTGTLVPLEKEKGES